MTTAILTHDLRGESRLTGYLGTLWTSWQAWRRQQAANRALARAGRLGPRLLADMGLETAETRALVGDWDTLMPNGYLVHPLGQERR